MSNPLNIGHRGARGHEPENTLLSVKKAFGLGADGVEIDVYFVDGELVVIHDDTLERTTNGSGPVEGRAFDYLRSLDAGKGERIPTLCEVFNIVNHRGLVNVELKGRGTAEPVADLISECVSEHGWKVEDFLVSSFDIDELKILKDRGLRLGLLMTEPPRDHLTIAKSISAWSLNVAWQDVSAGLVSDAHENGLKVLAYTVNGAFEIERMLEMRVDGLISDYPDRVAEAFEKRFS